MKKTYCFLLFLSICFIQSYAQDLLVTTANDSINCKVTAEKGNFIYFNFMHNGEFRKTLLAKSDVRQVVYNYFDQAILEPPKWQDAASFKRFRLSVNGGIGYRTAENPDDLSSVENNYLDELKSGGTFSADFSYFFSEAIGIGVKYNYFGSKNTIDNVTMDVNGDAVNETGSVTDDINIAFFGPMVSGMSYSGNRKNALFFNLALGYLHYLNKGELIGYDVRAKGSTFGLVGEIGYQIGLSETFSLAFTGSYTVGTLSKMKVGYGGAYETVKLEDDQKENLSRIELTVGLVFHR